MNYIKEITKKIDIINEVLNEIGVSPLLENSDFSLDEMSIKSWLKINLKDSQGKKIPLSLTFTSTGLEIRLDRIIEAIDWSDKDFTESSDIVKLMLKNLFTNHILVEYYGPSRTRIKLFGEDGTCTNNFIYQEGISLNMKRKDRLYFPIY